jgi:hypothetical protein
MNRNFIGGLQISEKFFHDVAEPLIKTKYPNLKFGAGLIGPGSEVLGFDTEMSTDHDWRPRFFVFLSEKDFRTYGKTLEKYLRISLPNEYLGHKIKTENVSDLRSRFVYSVSGFFEEYLGQKLGRRLSHLNWLTLNEHRLLTLTSGKIFRDDNGELRSVREKLNYYPDDVWKYLLASQWKKIFEEEAFVGRAGDVGDEIGSQIIAARIVQSLMRLGFLMEKKYVPYSKWFGSAFQKLAVSKKLNRTFNEVLNCSTWKKREKALSVAYKEIILMHNALGITKPIDPKVHKYHDRPYLVIGGDKIIEALLDQIHDKKIRKLPLIGSIDQFSDSVSLIDEPVLRSKLGLLYGISLSKYH